MKCRPQTLSDSISTIAKQFKQIRSTHWKLGATVCGRCSATYSMMAQPACCGNSHWAGQKFMNDSSLPAVAVPVHHRTIMISADHSTYMAGLLLPVHMELICNVHGLWAGYEVMRLTGRVVDLMAVPVTLMAVDRYSHEVFDMMRPHHAVCSDEGHAAIATLTSRDDSNLNLRPRQSVYSK